MERVVLADGTIVNDCGIGITSSGIWVNARNADMLTVVSLFGNPALTETMRFEYGHLYDVLVGYTKISIINCDDPAVIKIRMTGGSVEAIGLKNETEGGGQ